MPQKSIEIILFRQLASYLSIPICLLNLEGNIVYCNSSAENLLGFKFSEIGEISGNHWEALFPLKDKHGEIVSIDKSPLHISIAQNRITHGLFHITNLNHQVKHFNLTIIPMIDDKSIVLGSMLFFQVQPI